ncbi:MAG: dihydrofolate reductase family protein [Gaiellaceae bacterium]
MRRSSKATSQRRWRSSSRPLGENILKFGTGEVDRTLIGNELVDEFHCWVFPVLAGGGQRLIEGIDTAHLKLVDTTTFGSGIVVHTYAPK